MNFSTKRILFSCKLNLKLHNFQSSSLFSFEFPFSSSTGISIVQFLKVSAPACNKIMHFFVQKQKTQLFLSFRVIPWDVLKVRWHFIEFIFAFQKAKQKKAEKRHLWLLREKFLGNKNILLILDCLNKISDKVWNDINVTLFNLILTFCDALKKYHFGEKTSKMICCCNILVLAQKLPFFHLRVSSTIFMCFSAKIVTT